jgi:hypothetical protein
MVSVDSGSSNLKNQTAPMGKFLVIEVDSGLIDIDFV